jgi:TonB-dependent receptor
MRSLKAFLIVLVCSLFLLFCAQAQTGRGRKGTISGHVTDSSGSVLQGAEITIEDKGINVASDVQGEFFIFDLDPGSYKVKVSYVGFTDLLQGVEVSAGQVATFDAKLVPQSQNLEVLVTAERASAEAEAVNIERAVDNLIQVLPADVIRSLPNANMADALGRLPSVTLERDEGEGKYVQIRGTEPRLTNTTVDGVNLASPESGVRQIKFDAIPADIVESVQINKTLQANMDGDGIGGSVNLVTKTAGERPTFNLSSMGGYTPIVNGRGLIETTGTVGQRFGSQRKFGVLIGGSYDWNGRGIDDIEPVSDIATGGSLAGPTLWKDAIDVRQYEYYRTRWGLAGSADYKLSEGSDIYIRGLYSDFKNYGNRWVYSLNDNTNVTTLGGNGGTPSYNTQIRRPAYGIGSLLLGGRHVLNTTWYSWDISASHSQVVNHGYGQANFSSTLNGSSCQFDPTATKDIYLPQWNAACFTEAYDPATMALSNIRINYRGGAQTNLQAAGAAAKRYHLGSHVSMIEVGGKFRNAHKFDNSYQVKTNATGSIPLSLFKDSFSNSNYYNGTYHLGPNAKYEDVVAYANAHPLLMGTPNDTQGVDPANFDLVEKVSSGYVMDTVDLSSRVRVVAGLRFEGTNLGVRNFLFDQTNGKTTPTTFTGSYLTILPSVSLRYAFTGNTNLRLVYSRGLSRPDPVAMAQSLTFTTSGQPGSLKNLLTLGNPNLKAEKGDSFDLLVEHYLNPFGMFSAGYFYKRLSDPIVTGRTTLTNFVPAPGYAPGTYTATQPVNAGSAWISGFEAAYLQHMTFLPGFLSGLGLSANYGYTASKAIGIPGRPDNPRLLRNAPNTWNLSPTYDRNRLSIRLGVSYNQANIYAYSGVPSGPFGDTYFYTHLQVDVQGSYSIGKGLSFVMYGLNLNDAVFGFYQGSPQYMIQREYYKPTVAAGFRWSPTHERK